MFTTGKVVRSVVLLLGLVIVLHALQPYFINFDRLLDESINYFYEVQQPCGGFFDCEYRPTGRADLAYAFYISDVYPISYKLAKPFDEQNYLVEYPLDTVYAPLDSGGVYTWDPFYDVLAILSMNDSSPLCYALYKVITDNFDASGLRLVYVNTNPWLYPSQYHYDFGLTLLALEVAAKSKKVDGYMDDQALLTKLDPNFWTELVEFLKSPGIDLTSPTYDMPFATLIQIALGYPLHREDVCKALNETYFSKIYGYYKNATVVMEYAKGILGSLGNAALICARYGYLNYTYAKVVEEWVLESAMIRNGGQLPTDNWIYLDAYRLMLGQEPRGYLLFSVDELPPPPPTITVRYVTLTINKTLTVTDITTLTKVITTVLTSTTVTTLLVPITITTTMTKIINNTITSLVTTTTNITKTIITTITIPQTKTITETLSTTMTKVLTTTVVLTTEVVKTLNVTVTSLLTTPIIMTKILTTTKVVLASTKRASFAGPFLLALVLALRKRRN